MSVTAERAYGEGSRSALGGPYAKGSHRSDLRLTFHESLTLKRIHGVFAVDTRAGSEDSDGMTGVPPAERA